MLEMAILETQIFKNSCGSMPPYPSYKTRAFGARGAPPPPLLKVLDLPCKSSSFRPISLFFSASVITLILSSWNFIQEKNRVIWRLLTKADGKKDSRNGLRIDLDNSLPIPRSVARDLRTCFDIWVGTRQRAAPRCQPKSQWIVMCGGKYVYLRNIWRETKNGRSC